MSHFAEIDNDGIVQRVIVAEQDFINSGAVGDSFRWVQTSYNHNFRKQFAGIGYQYDKNKDIFIATQPYPSWVLDENSDWKAPVDEPVELINGRPRIFKWDEDNQEWVYAAEVIRE